LHNYGCTSGGDKAILQASPMIMPMNPVRFTILTLLLLATLQSDAQVNNDVLENTLYRVTAYKKNDTTVWSMSNYKEVVRPQSIFIPNAFTPNGDGINDGFGVKGEGIEDFTLTIFNRWGEIIFESSDPREKWDGSFKQQPCELGNYIYTVNAKNLGRKSMTGTVALVR
jgi:gliding motility-associated-like protein